MNAFQLSIPQDKQPIIIWKKPINVRENQKSTARAEGDVNYLLLHEILKKRIETYTNPPDNERLKRELNDIIKDCSIANWNGYEAEPLDIKSVEYVCQFLELLPNDISYPELCPEPNGDLTMVWNKRGYHMVFGIDSASIISWGGTTPHGKSFGEVKFTNDVPEEVLSLLRNIEGNI